MYLGASPHGRHYERDQKGGIDSLLEKTDVEREVRAMVNIMSERRVFLVN